MARSRSTAELRAENCLLRQFRTAEGVTSVIRELIRWGGLILITRYLYLTVAALAGQQTTADIGINLLADLRITEAFAILFGSSGIAYALGQRKLRRDTVERLQGRIKKYERLLDPERSSSNLTARGETRPEDEV
jgi:hypothetical protein